MSGKDEAAPVRDLKVVPRWAESTTCLTLEQIAKRLGRSRTGIWRLRSDPAFPAPVGRRGLDNRVLLFDAAEIEAYAAKLETQCR